MVTAPLRTSNFIGSLGVNTHIPYTDGGYADITNVAADLSYLGITNVRDDISNGAGGSAPLSSYITLAKQGIKFTFVIDVGGAATTASLMATLSLIDQVDEAVPGSVVAVEGANEINNYPLSYNGVSGLQGAINMQTALYAAVKSDPNLPGVAVDYFTGYGAGGFAQGPDPATTPGLADYDTQHPYPNYGSAPAGYVAPSVALSNEPSGTGPAVYTETGYSTNGGTNGAVNADVQAKYTLDLLFDDAKNGISRTYLYQLMDAYAAGSPQGDDGYGLFGTSNAPKESATAIHNLTSILADTGATAATFTPVAINDTVSGLPATGNSLVMEKSTGAYDIVVWNEPQIWNETTGTEITVPPVTVSVGLGAAYRNVEVFDPLVSASPIAAYSNVSTVKLAVTDHPLIVEVEPGLAAAAAPAVTIVGTAGETITTRAGTTTLVSLGAGTETVQSYGADTIIAGTGNAIIYGNKNTAAVTAIGGGAGTTTKFIMDKGTVMLEGGTDVVTTYSGGLVVDGGSGTAQVSFAAGGNTLVAGSGTLTMLAGDTGYNVYDFIAGKAGGTVNLFGFNVATDFLTMSGYSATVAQMVAAERPTSRGMSLALGDGTHINIIGIDSLSAANFTS